MKKTVLQLVVTIGLSVLSGAAFAQAPAAPAATAKPLKLEIPAQPIEYALSAFAEQSGIQVVFYTDLASGLTAPPLSGTYTPSDALAKLLGGTALEAQFFNSSTVAIREAAKDKDQPVAKTWKEAELKLAQQNTTVPKTDSSPQTAQSSAPPSVEPLEESLQEVVVTGSHIRGTAPVGSELLVINREQIDRSGFATVTDLLASLPQNAGGSAQEQSFGFFEDRPAINNRGGGTAANLRGLGGGGTLVLLNGRRLTPSGSGSFVDISMLPLSAVERVEILLDGSSSIYGSDAIAGAINFILRKNYDGAESRARYGMVTEGDLDETRLGQTLGKSWGSGHALLNYEFYDRGNLRSSERDFAAAAEDPTNLLPAQKRHSAILSGAQAIGPRVTVFGEALYSRRNSQNITTDEGLTIESSPTARQYNLTAGSSIQLGHEWALEVSGLLGHNDERSHSQFPDTLLTTRVQFDLTSFDAKADGPVFSLPAGASKLALGMATRQESLKQGAAQDRFDRDIYSAFGEWLLPLFSQANKRPGLRTLDLSISARAERYSDFGSTVNPKYGILWTPLSGLNLRASYGTSFKAPLLVDFSTVENNAILFDIEDPSSADGTTLALFLNGGNPDLEAETATTWSVGADFTPLSTPRLHLQASYFDIHFKNRISTLPITVLTSVIDAAATFSPAVRLNPGAADVEGVLASSPVFLDFYGLPFTSDDVEAIVDSRLINLAVANVRGVDFEAGYGLQIPAGAVDFSFGGSYLLDFQQGASPQAPLQEFVSTSFSPADLQLRGSGTFSRAGFSATAAVNYVDGYRDILTIPRGSIDSWTTFDLNLIYNTASQQGEAMPGNISFLLSVQNLFDKNPPFASSPPLRTAAGYDPANASALGRFMAFEIRKRW